MADTATSTPSDATATNPSSGKTGLTDSIREHFSGDAPILDKARGFAKARPFASAALAGVIGIALLNTLRGKR